jgi:hypothetical protein
MIVLQKTTLARKREVRKTLTRQFKFKCALKGRETPRSSKILTFSQIWACTMCKWWWTAKDTKFRTMEWKFIKDLNFYLSRSEKVSQNGFDFRIRWDFHAPYKFYRFLRRREWDFRKVEIYLFHEKRLSFTQTADIHKKGLHSQKGCNNIMQVNYFNVSLGCLFPSPSFKTEAQYTPETPCHCILYSKSGSLVSMKVRETCIGDWH